MKKGFFETYQEFFGIVSGCMIAAFIFAGGLSILGGRTGIVQPVYALPGDVHGSPNLPIKTFFYADPNNNNHPSVGVLYADGRLWPLGVTPTPTGTPISPTVAGIIPGATRQIASSEDQNLNPSPITWLVTGNDGNLYYKNSNAIMPGWNRLPSP